MSEDQFGGFGGNETGSEIGGGFPQSGDFPSNMDCLPTDELGGNETGGFDPLGGNLTDGPGMEFFGTEEDMRGNETSFFDPLGGNLTDGNMTGFGESFGTSEDFGNETGFGMEAGMNCIPSGDFGGNTTDFP
jgi:hypothetical protein